MSSASAETHDLDTPVIEIARTDFVRLFDSETVEECLARLRKEQLGERIFYFYVADPKGRLVGIVPTRRLLLADPASPVAQIMIRDVISVNDKSSFREALNLLATTRLLAVPVVDDHGVMNGVIDISHYAREHVNIERRGEAEEVFQLVGIHIEQERVASPAAAFRNRFPWLLCNIGSGLAAAYIAGIFGGSLEAAVALAFFIPVVLALAESVAIQSLTLTLQAFQLSAAGAFPVGGIGQQVSVGWLIGVAGGAIVGAFGLAWLRDVALSLVVLGGMIFGAVIGTVIGYLFPRLVHRWKLDPTVASGPAVLALTDLGTLTAYLSLAATILGG